MLWKLAWKDISRFWKFSAFFVLNLSIGLTGFLSLETFKEALKDYLANNAKQILAGDLAVTARRELTEDESKVLAMIESKDRSLSYDFFAMAAFGTQSRLVLVKAVDSNFPMYGGIQNTDEKLISAADLANQNKLWIYPEVRDYFSIQVGEKLKLGQVEFEVAEVVGKDTTLTFRNASLAPRVYIPLSQLKSTGLIQFGSTFTQIQTFTFNSDSQSEAALQAINKGIPDPAVRIENPQSASEDSGRQLNYLSDYLGLVTLVALFLSAIGASYLFRLFIQQKLKDIAILRSLGLKGRTAIAVFLIEILILSLLSVLLSAAFSMVLFPILQATLQNLTPFPLQLALSLDAFLLALLIITLGSFCISFPYLYKLQDVSVSQLFSEEHFQSDLGAIHLGTLLPSFILFTLLAIYQAQSWILGLGFTLGLVLGIVLLSVVGLALITAIAKLRFKSWQVRFSILSMSRRKVASLALFVSIALGSLLINILPQLKTTLQSSMESEEASKLPSLFMFDIQDEQEPQLRQFLEEKKISSLDYSAMVRARILKINDQDYERKASTNGFASRDEERETRSRNRGANLTYRAQLGQAETLYKGKPFSGKFDPELAELSVERRFADRTDIELNDIITFDVQGLEIKGIVVNLRDVKWTSFQPNFFIVVQPGFLEDAPKTFITALPRIPVETKQELTREMADLFPNVSIIDVDRLVQDILNLADQMSLSLELMAWLALLAGYVVLFSIVRSQVTSRRWELNMLKILGAKKPDLRRYLLIEVIVVSTLASLLGTGLSFIASFVLSFYLFESRLIANLSWPFFSIVGIVLISYAVGLLASRKVMDEKPGQILMGDLN